MIYLYKNSVAMGIPFRSHHECFDYIMDIMGTWPSAKMRLDILNGRTITVNGDHFQFLAEESCVSACAA